MSWAKTGDKQMGSYDVQTTFMFISDLNIWRSAGRKEQGSQVYTEQILRENWQEAQWSPSARCAGKNSDLNLKLTQVTVWKPVEVYMKH